MSTLLALDLLSTIENGRLVLTRFGMPAIRPVNHLVDGGQIVIHTSLPARGAADTAGIPMADAVTVSYEAEHLDPLHAIGWSVIVTGMAMPVMDPARHHRCAGRLPTWVQRTGGSLIQITPVSATGFQRLN